MYQKYKDYGFIIITVADEDTSYGAPATSDLSAWATNYGLTFPVVADPTASVDSAYDPSHTSRPTYVLLGPGAEVVKVGKAPSDAEIEALLPATYP